MFTSICLKNAYQMCSMVKIKILLLQFTKKVIYFVDSQNNSVTQP